MSIQFSGEITDFKIVYNVLKAVSFKEHAIIRPLEEGLKVTIEEMRCIETSVYIPCNMFTFYSVSTDNIKFKLSLKVLTECLHIFGDDGNPSLKMTYNGVGFPLLLVLKHSEENITVSCEIQTMEVDDSNELSLAYECTANKIVLNAASFVDILGDLDNASDEMELLLSSESPYIRITTHSVMGESQTDISKMSEMVLLFQCDNKLVSKYSFQYIRQILKAMSFANKVSMSTGDSGLLGLQLAIKADEKQMYVEYYVTALLADD